MSQGLFEKSRCAGASEIDEGVGESGIWLEVYWVFAGGCFVGEEIVGVQDKVGGRREFGEAEAELGGELVSVSFQGGFDYG